MYIDNEIKTKNNIYNNKIYFILVRTNRQENNDPFNQDIDTINLGTQKIFIDSNESRIVKYLRLLPLPSYQQKYIKYKNKYLKLKNIIK